MGHCADFLILGAVSIQVFELFVPKVEGLNFLGLERNWLLVRVSYYQPLLVVLGVFFGFANLCVVTQGQSKNPKYDSLCQVGS